MRVARVVVRDFYMGLLRFSFQIALLALLYFALGRVGTFTAIPPGLASAVWPASGLALAALLRFGIRLWPGIALGSLVLNVPILWSQGGTGAVSIAAVLVGLSVATGSTIQAIVGARGFRRFAPQKFETPTSTLGFIISAAGSALIAPTIAVCALRASGFIDIYTFAKNWLTWYLGDLIGIIVVTPLLFTAHEWKMDWRPSRIAEALLLLVLLFAGMETVFGFPYGNYVTGYPFVYLFIPLVVWTSFRFRQAPTLYGVAFLASLVVIATVMRHGPFVIVRRSLNQSLLLLQTFVGVVAGMGLLLTSVIRERDTLLIRAGKKNYEWLFSVFDNGLGIASEECEKIFEVFHRSPHSGVSDGTGIGLATCKQIIEQHGGTMWVESAPGLGSHFQFAVPIAPRPA